MQQLPHKPPARRLSAEERRLVVVFLAPALAVYALMVLWPIAQTGWLSLHQWRGVSADMTYIGLENFRRLFTDEHLGKALLHNVYFWLMVSFGILTLGLVFSQLLARSARGTGFYRALFLFPNVISVVAVAVLWQLFYSQDGPLSRALAWTPLLAEPLGFLGEATTVLPAVSLTWIWYALGFYVMLFLAGTLSISTDVQEAAEVDGASGWRRFRLVTLPLLSGILKLGVLHLFIVSINTFALIHVMTQGGPFRSSEVVLTYLYEQAFDQRNFGYACAIGVLNLGIVVTATSLLNRFWRSEGN